jgi:hypothetical protein
MPAFQVLSVSNSAKPPNGLWGSLIEAPEPGSSGEEHVVHLKGWVLGRQVAVESVEVSYRPEPPPYSGDRLVRVSEIHGYRPDIAAAFPDAGEAECGFEALVGLIGMTPELELCLSAALSDGSRVPIGSLRVRREPLRTDFEPRLQPITISCLGRTGTTLLLRLLAAHPQIVVYQRFPFELSAAKYWVHALKVLAEPANYEQSSHPDTFLSNLWFVGHNPYYDHGVAADPVQHRLMGRRFVERLAVFMQESIDEWYAAVAESQGRVEAAYFAEKDGSGHIANLIGELYPKRRELFLVRDFRDMASSVLAFNEKRGFASFGRLEGRTDEEYLREVLRPAVLGLYDEWRQRKKQAHLVRYEDLVLKPRETISALLAYLKLEASDRTIAALLDAAFEETPELEWHRTSADARSSIGRWREQGESFGALCEELFREPLVEFGYLERNER